MSDLMQKTKDQSLWALGHPKDIGGEGMPFMEYVYINEVVGRSSSAMVALGTILFKTQSCLGNMPQKNGEIGILNP